MLLKNPIKKSYSKGFLYHFFNDISMHQIFKMQGVIHSDFDIS